MNWKRMVVGFVLAAVFLYLFLRNMDPQQLWSAIRRGNPYWLILSGVLGFFNYFFRSYRWGFFFEPIKKTSLNNLFRTTIIGFAINTIFPAKIGEVVRPYLLGAKENISKSTAVATVVVERVFDTAAILFFLTIYLLLLLRPDELSKQAQASLSELNKTGVLLFGLVLGLILILYYLKTRPDSVKKLIRKIERILPSRISHSLDDILDSFIQGLSILHDPKILFKISYLSVLFWLLICGGTWASIRAYVPTFGFFSTFLIITFLAIGIAVPTPGGIGSYHFACQLGLTLFFDVPEADAAAVALVSHALVFVPVTILGLVFLWQEGLNAVKIRKMTEQTAESTG